MLCNLHSLRAVANIIFCEEPGSILGFCDHSLSTINVARMHPQTSGAKLHLSKSVLVKTTEGENHLEGCLQTLVVGHGLLYYGDGQCTRSSGDYRHLLNQPGPLEKEDSTPKVCL